MKVETYYKIKDKNIVVLKDTYNFIYKITPVNSLFGTDTQSHTLIETLKTLLCEINMCGAIYLLPQQVDVDKIVAYHEKQFESNYNPVLVNLKEEYMQDLKKNIYDQVYYRYHIYIVFTDNRSPLHKKFTDRWTLRETERPSKQFSQNLKFWEEEVYKKLQLTNLEVKRLKEQKEVDELLHYIAIPLEPQELQKTTQYYSIPTEAGLTYQYIQEGQTNELFTKTVIADKYKNAISTSKNNLINRIQLLNYPVDIIVKFDLVHSKEFKKKMRNKYNEIERSIKKYEKASETRERNKEALVVAELAKNIDTSVENTVFVTQTMFRFRAKTKNMLEARFQDLEKRLESTMKLQQMIGRQHILANNLHFYQTTCFEYYQDLNLEYFSSFNYLGGFYIGEEIEGLVVSYGKYNKVPIMLDYLKVLQQNATKRSAPTTIVAGETGSGKSQLVNHITLSMMLFYGAKTLVIDPKGDREKIIQKLGKEVASYLELGSEACMSGMFDPYYTSSDLKQGFENAGTLLIQMERMLNPKTTISLKKIEIAHQQMIEKINTGFYQHANLSNLMDELEILYPDAVENAASLKNHTHARLFFGNDFSDISKAFDFSKPYNLISLKGMPNLENYDKNNIHHQISVLLLSRVHEIVYHFINLYPTQIKTLLIDEYRLYKVSPGAEGNIEKLSRIARSNLMYPFIISQNVTDVATEIHEQTGMYLVGSLKTNQAIHEMLELLGMKENLEISQMLMDETKNEGVSEDRKYNFLMVDYNNRKSPCKLKFQDSFKEAFDTTLKKKEE